MYCPVISSRQQLRGLKCSTEMTLCYLMPLLRVCTISLFFFFKRSSVHLLLFVWQEVQTDLILPVTICFSLSSASPAHSPKEEYVITQCTDTVKEEAGANQEGHGEPPGDKSEPTEKKSLAGWLGSEYPLNFLGNGRETVR